MRLRPSPTPERELPPEYSTEARTDAAQPDSVVQRSPSNSRTSRLDQRLSLRPHASGSSAPQLPAAALVAPDYHQPSQESRTAQFDESLYTKKDKMALAQATMCAEEQLSGLIFAEVLAISFKEQRPEMQGMDMDDLASTIVGRLRESKYFDAIAKMKAEVYSAEVLLSEKELEGTDLFRTSQKFALALSCGMMTKKDFTINRENFEILKDAHKDKIISAELATGGIFDRGLGYASSLLSLDEVMQLSHYMKSPVGRKKVGFENHLAARRSSLIHSASTKTAMTKAAGDFIRNFLQTR